MSGGVRYAGLSRIATSAARYARKRPALLLFVAVLTAYRATQWGHFAVPAPDFFDFEHTAQALAAGHLPAQFQRAPVYPALIALISPLLGGARPALAAAQTINLLMSACALIVMYELCALFVGRWALLVVALSGLHWTLAYVTIHPLCEPALMVTMLGALFLDATARRGKYVAAGLAAATRYEGLFLVATLALCDLRRRRDATRIMPAAGLAILPGAVWFVLGLLRAANPYADVIAAQSPAGLEFLRSMAMSAIGALPVQVLEGALAGEAAARAVAVAAAVAAAGLMVIGAHRALRLHARTARALLLFGAAYVGIHMLYPAANTRFVLPILWLMHLLTVMGGFHLTEGARARYTATGRGLAEAAKHGVSDPAPTAPRGVAAAVGIAISVVAVGGAVWAARYDSLWVLPLSAPVAWALAAPAARMQRWVLMPALAMVALMVAGALGLGAWYVEREGRWWAELGPVGKWCEPRPPGLVRLAATRSVITLMRELHPHPRVRFYDLARLDSSGTVALPPDVTHLLWCSTDTPLRGQRPPLLLSQRYADERQQSIATGRWFVRRVAEGRDAGWRACARFEARGQQAVIYAREDVRQASAGAPQ